MIKKAENYFSTAYLLLMFCVYPFYVEEGYTNIGEAKNRFFVAVSMASFGVLLLLYGIHWISRAKERKKNGQAYLIDWEKVSVTDLLMLLYATEIFLSYVFSDNKEEALWGTKGWYMGLVPLLLLCGLYFLISRLWQGNEMIIYPVMVSTAVVCLLGICNRFSFYPIALAGAQPDFISTLGNINWFCGFLSVVAPLGIGVVVVRKADCVWKQTVVFLYAVIVFMAGFAQGSDSVFLWFGALFFLLLFISLDKKEYLARWFVLLSLWGLSAWMVKALRILTVDRFNYETSGICGYFTDSHVSVWIIAFAAAGYFWAKRQMYLEAEEKTVSGEGRERIFPEAEKIRKKKRTLIIFPIAILAVWIVLSWTNTTFGLPFLKENSLCTFDGNWGHGRGITFYTGMKIFGELPLLQKMLGTGPDCFAAVAYELPEMASVLRGYFGSSRLTNAHNEVITALVNTGVLGTALYVSILFVSIKKYLKAGRSNAIFYLFAVSILGYFIHNMVSFAQVLNFPFLFLILGMGEAEMRDLRVREREP